MVNLASMSSRGLDSLSPVDAIRGEFPILRSQVHGKPLVYLDSAATTQKPQCVIDAIVDYYQTNNSNVHRGVHALSQRATAAYEQARTRVRRFLNAREDQEIVFVRGTTEAINLVAQSFARPRLGAGDEILISHMEHHSNIVPWQMVCEQTGATLRVIPVTDTGELVMDEFRQMLSERTRIVSVIHVSNALGTINPVREIVEHAHAAGVPVMLDGAQAAAHGLADVAALDCDFYACSGHKLFGPTGIGVLYGKREHLEAMPPYQGGGDMIRSVSFEKTIYNDLPNKFEAGTPNIAGVIGLGAAIDFLTKLDRQMLHEHAQDLLLHATQRLSVIPQVKVIGTAAAKTAIVSFLVDGIHPHDVGSLLDEQGIAIRSGHHCTQPLMDRFGVPATARASMSIYNTRDEIDALVAGLEKVIEVFGV